MCVRVFVVAFVKSHSSATLRSLGKRAYIHLFIYSFIDCFRSWLLNLHGARPPSRSLRFSGTGLACSARRTGPTP